MGRDDGDHIAGGHFLHRIEIAVDLNRELVRLSRIPRARDGGLAEWADRGAHRLLEVMGNARDRRTVARCEPILEPSRAG